MNNRLLKNCINSLFFASLSFNLFSADIIANNGTVDWNNAKSWNLGRIPQCSDNIIIPTTSSVNVDDQINLTTGSACEKTQMNIFGKLLFKSGKKIRLSTNVKVNLYTTGQIQPSGSGGGNSELIEIGNQVFWKAGDGILKGKINYDIKSKFSDDLKKSTQFFKLDDASAGGVINGNKGTTIKIKPNALATAQGALVSGPVDIELIEITNRTDMILLNKSTMGRLPNGERAPLVSGGEYFLKISQKNQDLIIKEGLEVTMKVEKADGKMEIFDGEMNDKDQFTWTALKSSPKVEANSYSFIETTTGWTNIDKFEQDPRDKTKIRVKLPQGFDSKNAVVYVSFDGNRTLLAKLDEYTDDGFFTEHYGFLPIGMQIHVVALSNVGDSWMSAVKALTVSENMDIQIESLTPNTDQELVTNLTNMP